MATECEQQAVLRFIKERGGRVKNVDLTDHFRATIPKDPALKQVAKEAFKHYVDSVAYVKEENGEKYVCLKNRFRKSARSVDRDGPADELVPTGIPPEASDSNGGIKEGALPGSGYGTANAGGAKSQPDISVMFSEGVNGRTESELRTDMGNSSSSTADDKTAAGLKIDRSGGTCSQRSRSNTGEGRREYHSQEETGKENRPQCARLCQINSSTDEEQPDSSGSTPKRGRERFVQDLTSGLTSGSPQLRRSVALRNSVYLSGRCKDCPRADSDYEPAAVSLEPLEHEWMMCASDGHWESLQRLLVRDPSLITRKDFVTGFTCLHWAAKFGKEELIVLLVNFAKEHRVSVNVNARSSAGYTPLHLAAMHGHLEVVKLLVGAFDADVEARDYNGRKACQYLKSDIAPNLLEIVGACAESDAGSVDAGDASRWRLSRVIQSNFRPLKAQNYNGGEEDGGGGFPKHKSLRRKSSFNKMKPSLNKMRLRTQIVHSTSLLDRFEREPTDEPPRPKSNVFG